MKTPTTGFLRIRKNKRAQVFMMAVLVIAVYMATMVMLLANVNSSEDLSEPDNCALAVNSFRRELANQMQYSLAKTTKNVTSSYNAEDGLISFMENFEIYSSTSLGIHLELSLYTGSFSTTIISDLSAVNMQANAIYSSSIGLKIAFLARDVVKDIIYSGVIEANYTASAIVNGYSVILTEQLCSGVVTPALHARVTSSLNEAASNIDNGIYTFSVDPTTGYLNATLSNGVSVYST